MLGLKQFSTPQFMVPVAPANERPLHKMKDFMSFLNSLQWKADDEAAEDTEPEPQTGKMDSGNIDSLTKGLDWSIGNPLEYDESVYTPKERTNPLSDEDKEIAENFGKTIDDLWYNAVRKGRSDAYWDKAPFMTPEGRL